MLSEQKYSPALFKHPERMRVLLEEKEKLINLIKKAATLDDHCRLKFSIENFYTAIIPKYKSTTINNALDNLYATEKELVDWLVRFQLPRNSNILAFTRGETLRAQLISRIELLTATILDKDKQQPQSCCVIA